jgi:tetratricopeptide (TPR) repeat protein
LYQAALDSAGQGLALATDARLLLLCADICNQIAEYEAAADYARAAIALDPGDADAHGSLAWALQHVPSSRGEECEAAFEQVLALTGADPRTRLYALKGRAGARRARGREEEARVDYESVLAALEPEDDSWLAGWAHYSLGHYEDAATAYRQALAVDGSRVGARFDLGLTYAVAGKEDALDAYRAAFASVDEREPRGRLAPLRVALDDLKDAERVGPELMSEAVFRQIVEDVEERLNQTESLLGELFLPKIPEEPA